MRPLLSSTRKRSLTGNNVESNQRNSNVSRSPATSSSTPTSNRNPSRARTDPNDGGSGGNRSGRSKLNSSSPIIMTKAQLKRRAALPLIPSNSVRTVNPAETESGPTVTSRVLPSTTNSSPRSTATARRTITSNTRANHANVSRTLGVNSVNHTQSGKVPLNASTTSAGSPRIRTLVSAISSGRPGEFHPSNPRFASTAVPAYRPRKPRNKVTFDLPDTDNKNAVAKVLSSEKILPRILGLMNWNELLPLRTTCKSWFEIIESHPLVKTRLGIIVLRPQVESKMAIYNTSSVTWSKFRFIGPTTFDMAKPTQHEFWSKHGPLMVHLEISNRSMTLTGLVEILARCPKLEFFKCNWTPEMYSFNSELIKKYYGIHFNNGTFANLETLEVECSASLTDSALWSILKWCAGSLRTLKLTSPPEEDILTRLRPRWSIESIKNYFDRFGYTGNLQYLDFSWSNLTPEDIQSLASIDMNLRGINLNYCRLDDQPLRKLLLKHGETLEVLKIEGTSFTDAIFCKEILPKIKILHIGGLKGTIQSLGFLTEMPHLEELSCHKTKWLDHSMILRPLNAKIRQKVLKSLDFGGGIKHGGNKKLDPNLNKTWFSDFIGLIPHITELNLSRWTMFGTDANFKTICHSLILLEKLVVRHWELLTDIGTTGLYEEEIHQEWGTKLPTRPRVFIGLLKRLTTLDVSGTAITDASVNLALSGLTNLRSLAVDSTKISDTGVRGLINKITSLDRISVSKCPNISISQTRIQRADGRMVSITNFK